jgi:hypothetical protein
LHSTRSEVWISLAIITIVMSKKRRLAGTSIFAHLPQDLKSSLRAQKFAAVEETNDAASSTHHAARIDEPADESSGGFLRLSKTYPAHYLDLRPHVKFR